MPPSVTLGNDQVDASAQCLANDRLVNRIVPFGGRGHRRGVEAGAHGDPPEALQELRTLAVLEPEDTSRGHAHAVGVDGRIDGMKELELRIESRCELDGLGLTRSCHQRPLRRCP